MTVRHRDSIGVHDTVQSRPTQRHAGSDTSDSRRSGLVGEPVARADRARAAPSRHRHVHGPDTRRRGRGYLRITLHLICRRGRRAERDAGRPVNPEPVIVTLVPPPAGPALGLTPVTVGAGTFWNTQTAPVPVVVRARHQRGAPIAREGHAPALLGVSDRAAAEQLRSVLRPGSVAGAREHPRSARPRKLALDIAVIRTADRRGVSILRERHA